MRWFVLILSALGDFLLFGAIAVVIAFARHMTFLGFTLSSLLVLFVVRAWWQQGGFTLRPKNIRAFLAGAKRYGL
jgi:hypothetical protein